MSLTKRIFFLLMVMVWMPVIAGISRADVGFDVVVGIAPYAYLAEKIGGDTIQVHTLMSQNQDPHTYEPSPKQFISLGKARIFFLSGLDFEDRLFDKILKNFPALTFVDLSEGLVPEKNTHNDERIEHHGETDQHLWLSPPLFSKQAEKVARFFSLEDPKNKDVYYKNLYEFQKEIDQITSRIAIQMEPFKGRSFFVFHPAFAYFGEAFGLHQRAVETSGHMPTPKKIAGLIALAKKEKVQVIFVQPQFDQVSAKIVASSIGGAVVAIDPLEKNVLRNFSVIADQMERAFQ